MATTFKIMPSEWLNDSAVLCNVTIAIIAISLFAATYTIHARHQRLRSICSRERQSASKKLIGEKQVSKGLNLPSIITAFFRFFYASFLKPHRRDQTRPGQQAALESFYKAQADVYDTTRQVLLRGREDMLGMCAAQLKYNQAQGAYASHRPIWVDVGGGTGYNIEAMANYVDVPNFFEAIYLVDLSPSLLAVAKKRFLRLGWNVQIFCEDARNFRLPNSGRFPRHEKTGKGQAGTNASGDKADLITMSYSLSMIPDYYSVLDTLPTLLAPHGLIGVVDFYVQSIVEISGRTYTGGCFNRHVTWLGRVFWRAWFDVDRVGLEGARRDYLEYKFGTLKTVDERNYWLGGIPYYLFLGRQRDIIGLDSTDAEYGKHVINQVDASCTESPYLSPRIHQGKMNREATEQTLDTQLRSKTYQCAIVNLTANIPLPSMFYQNHHQRIYYDDQLRKHTQFKNEFIYAFTWEDPRVDLDLLKINSEHIVLCITSAGDNVLDYLIHAKPRRLHAVDLNPNQNHLLELKMAAFRCLSYDEIWHMFGLGRLSTFRDILISRLSPHLSSQACQYWLNHATTFSSTGLYNTGGSRHAIKMTQTLFRILGLSHEVRKLCSAETIAEQQAIWPKIRRVLLSPMLHRVVVSTEWFAWKAAGVPASQRSMITGEGQQRAVGSCGKRGDKRPQSEAIWQYIVDTLDPIVGKTLLSNNNYFYLLCLQGRYSRKCHPSYLSHKAYDQLSTPGAFDGVRIHTDEIQEVVERLKPCSLDFVVIMDSMDWFDPLTDAASIQICQLHKALQPGGKVMLRSAGLHPWYIRVFEDSGFSTERVGARINGACIDRVNMYASTWICTKHDKVDDHQQSTPSNAATTISSSTPCESSTISEVLDSFGNTSLGPPMLEDS